MSDALWYHHREAQNHSPEHSHSPFLDGGIIFPPLSGMLDPCQSSSNNWKLISFGTTWLHPKLVLIKKKKKKLALSFSPSLASLYLFEQWLRLGVTSTSSVWLPLQDESLYVFPNCKSLWIKASAKWLNVNVKCNFTNSFLSRTSRSSDSAAVLCPAPTARTCQRTCALRRSVGRARARAAMGAASTEDTDETPSAAPHSPAAPETHHNYLNTSFIHHNYFILLECINCVLLKNSKNDILKIWLHFILRCTCYSGIIHLSTE